jgi:hypothetical protein
MVEACLLKYAGDDEIMKVDFLDAIDETKLLRSNNPRATLSLITLSGCCQSTVSISFHTAEKYRELVLSVRRGEHMSSLVALDWLLTPAHRVPRQLLGTLLQHLVTTAGELYAALADRSSTTTTREQVCSSGHATLACHHATADYS